MTVGLVAVCSIALLAVARSVRGSLRPQPGAVARRASNHEQRMFNRTRRWPALVGLVLVAVALAACGSTGTGTGAAEEASSRPVPEGTAAAASAVGRYRLRSPPILAPLC